MPIRKTRSNGISLAPVEETDDASTELKMPAQLESKLSQISVTSSSSSSSSSSDDPKESRLQQIQSELHGFQAVIHSNPSSFLAEMNSLVRQSFPTFYEFANILRSESAFDKKTFLEEVTKTKTTLYTPRGVKITNPEHVARYLTVESAGRRKPHELLYKAANSKIFERTCIIESLTKSNGLIRPELNAKATIKDCSFEISLSDGKPHLVAECFLNVTIPSSSSRKHHHHEKSASRWNVVGVVVEVYFCIYDETLRVELLHLSPGKQLSERQLRDVAKESVRRSSKQKH